MNYVTTYTYDNLPGRWLLPDPAEQFSNPYLAMGNNPVMYVDPDGQEIITAMIVGGMIGAFSGAMAAGYSGASNAQIMAAMGIGAVAGVAGGAAGGAVGGSMGAATTLSGAIGQGVVTGAAGGFVGGFVGGAGNAWVGGADFREGLNEGLIAGSKGIASGALIGGVSGALHFSAMKKKFNKQLSLDGDGINSNPDGSLDPSNTTLNEFSDQYFKDFIYRETARLNYDNAKVSGRGGNKFAFTESVETQGKFNVYFGDKAFSDKFTLFMTMGHEYVHVAHLSSLSGFTESLSEFGAWSWNKKLTNYSKGQDFNKIAAKRVEHFTPVRPSVADRAMMENLIQFRSWGLPDRIPQSIFH